MTWRAVLFAILAISVCLQAEHIAIRSYTTTDGLAADQIDRIVPDSHGFIWFCTPEGLTRFDGYRMVTFGTRNGFPHRAVQDFLETRAGEFLVATPRGLCRWRSGAGNTQPATYLPGKTQLENDITSLLEAPSGRIWCGTSDGVFEIQSGFRFRRQPLAKRLKWTRTTVTDLVEDREGTLWVATTSGIDIVGRNGADQYITPAEGLPNEWVNSLLLDESGRVWAGTRGGLVLMSNRGVERVYRDPANVSSMALGPDGALWVATALGISRFPPNAASAGLQNFTRDNGLTDRNIYSLAADKAGNIWAGTEGAGAMRIQPTGFTTYREQDGLASDRAAAVFGNRSGALLAVTDKAKGRSVDIFDGVRFRPAFLGAFCDRPGWGRHQQALQSRTGEWWAATSAGLCRYAAVSAARLNGTKPAACYATDLQIFELFEDSRGGIWASAQSDHGDKLIRWDPDRGALTWFSDGPSKSPLLVSAFAEDRNGNVWMGLYVGTELYRYDGRQFTKYGRGEGVPGGTVFALLADHAGRLWAGSIGGLALIEDPGSSQPRVRTYDTTNGLSSNTVWCIVEDNAGRIYAGTLNGVDRLNPKTGRWKYFSAADGLARGQMTSAFRDMSGNLWFATAQGLSRLTPVAEDAPTIPAVRITGLRVGQRERAVSQIGETFISGVELRPDQNQLQIDFAGFSSEPEENLRYSYKLEGGDTEWHPPSRDHGVNYPGLSSGDYRFLVKGVNSEGRESAKAAEIDFTVLPPFWRRWWFESLVAAIIAAAIYAMHRYRVSQMLEVERIRTAIATDLHDDIGASLSQIAILSEVARVGGQDEPLRKIASLARELVDSMGDIVWSIRAEPDGMESLIRRMREFAIDVLASRSIGFELRTPRSGPHLHLGLQARRQLFLIYKECVNNIARHSGCTRAEAEFTLAVRQVMLRIHDNGKGLSLGEPRRCGGGNGIPNMKRRAQSVGGAVEVLSAPGEGCTVVVRLPL
jgi:ligand-binding sensor domain-containing protein